MVVVRSLSLALVATLLAGCGAKDLTTSLAPIVPGTAPVPEHDAETCAIHGTIVDDEESPIPAAHVGLLGQDLRTTQSARDGRFTFSYVQPGLYNIAASRFGFDRALVPIICEADTLHEPVVPMESVPIPGFPHHVLLEPMRGHIVCAYGASGGSGSLSSEWCRLVDADSKTRFSLKLENATTTALHVELVWTPSSSNSGKTLSLLHPNPVHKDVNYTTNGVHYLGGRSASGASPIEFTMESTNLTKSLFAKKKGTTVDVEVRAYSSRPQDLIEDGANDRSSGLVYEQPFTVYAAVFYEGMTVPDGFRARPE